MERMNKNPPHPNTPAGELSDTNAPILKGSALFAEQRVVGSMAVRKLSSEVSSASRRPELRTLDGMGARRVRLSVRGLVRSGGSGGAGIAGCRSTARFPLSHRVYPRPLDSPLADPVPKGENPKSRGYTRLKSRSSTILTDRLK